MRSTFANFFTQAEIVRTELVALFQNDFARQAVFSRVVDCHLILSALLRFLVHFVHLLHLNLGVLLLQVWLKVILSLATLGSRPTPPGALTFKGKRLIPDSAAYCPELPGGRCSFTTWIPVAVADSWA